MNKQTTFNRVYKKMLAQGFQRSLRNGGTQCAYRGENGMRCAAGALVTGREYRVGYEGCKIDSCPLGRILEGKGHDLVLVAELQLAHDRSSTPAIMLEKLREVAHAHGLEVPK